MYLALLALACDNREGLDLVGEQPENGDTNVGDDADDTDGGGDTDPDSDTEDTDTEGDTDAVAEVLIVEVADHADVANAKYVELYNPGPGAVSLSGYTLRRYANGAGTSQGVALTDVLLQPDTTWVVAYSQSDFESLFAPADQYSVIISGNGNDVYELFYVDRVVDIYGEVLVDGEGTDWEYADSVAKRKGSVTAGNPVWTKSEWTITAGTSEAKPHHRD